MSTTSPSQPPNTQDFRWTRFAAPQGAPVGVDQSGFLVDPDSLWGHQNKTLMSIDELERQSFVALLGMAGIGKSTSLRALYENRANQSAEDPWLHCGSICPFSRPTVT